MLERARHNLVVVSNLSYGLPNFRKAYVLTGHPGDKVHIWSSYSNPNCGRLQEIAKRI